MSRTDNTMPTRIQEEDGRYECWTAGGSYSGIGQRSRVANRQSRHRVRAQLQKGQEPDVTRPRHGEKYVYY